jgi:histidinol-phosphate aminotransferase
MNCNLTEVNPNVISERVFKDGMVFLDWNESSYLPKCVSDDLKKTALNELNQYPDPTNKELKLQISKYTGVSTDFIECFNGSDSALDYTFRTLLNKKNKVLIPYPNYTQINQTIQSLGGKVKYCDITNLENQIISEKPQIVYLSVPNNPIGYVYDVMPLVKKYSNIYFIVDEAYYEYYKEYSVFDLAYRYNNLISVRTFSKGLGLAGVRLGYLTANSYIINKIRSIKNFKDVSRLAEYAGVSALKNINIIEKDINETLQTKKDFISKLKGVRVYDSYANFVLIEHPKIKEIISNLKDNNILVRDRSKFINNTIRITIGKPKVMEKVAEIINNNSI